MEPILPEKISCVQTHDEIRLTKLDILQAEQSLNVGSEAVLTN